MYESIRKDIDKLDRDIQNMETAWAEHRLLDFYAKVVPRIMNAESCSIFIARTGGSQNWIRAGTNAEEEVFDASRISALLVAEVMREGETVFRDKLDEQEGGQELVDVEGEVKARDVLCVPIFSVDGEEITGAIQILNRLNNGEPYTEEELTLMAELAHYLEVSFENIYLFEEARGVVGRTWIMLKRVTIIATVAFFAVMLAFSLYWFGFFLAGGVF